MPLIVNLRHLEKKTLDFEGALGPEELAIDPVDELVKAERPVEYRLNVERMGQSLLVQGELSLVLSCQCSRCLKKFDQELALEGWACDVPLEGEEAAPLVNDCVDLTPYLREDILLAFPQHPLCDLECSGLDGLTTQQPSGVEQLGSSSAWAELNKLKL